MNVIELLPKTVAQVYCNKDVTWNENCVHLGRCAVGSISYTGLERADRW